MKKKSAALVLALALLVVGAAAGTLAWLTAKSDTVTNTFTTSGITVKLEETTGAEYKMIPGYTIEKDPAAWVETGSEDCYLFVKLEKSAGFDNFLTYAIADGWTELTGTPGVYYRTVTSAEMGSRFTVLKDNQVAVKGDVTQEMMAALNADGAVKPTLTVTAYASQLHKNAAENFDVAAAWSNIANQ